MQDTDVRSRHPLEKIVAERPSHRPGLPRAHWWQPGVYGSVPAVLLWILARLPADLLTGVFGHPAIPTILNHAGDTVFVAGWLASAAWLWFTRRRQPRKAGPVDDGRPAAPARRGRHHHAG